jgi:hypothetical protein
MAWRIFLLVSYLVEPCTKGTGRVAEIPRRYGQKNNTAFTLFSFHEVYWLLHWMSVFHHSEINAKNEISQREDQVYLINMHPLQTVAVDPQPLDTLKKNLLQLLLTPFAIILNPDCTVGSTVECFCSLCCQKLTQIKPNTGGLVANMTSKTLNCCVKFIIQKKNSKKL